MARIMKEFVDKLIDRLGQELTALKTKCPVSVDYDKGIYKAQEIIKRFVEEYNNGWIPYSETKLPPAGYVRDVWLTLEDGVFKAVWMRDHFEWENEFLVTETPIAWKFCDIPEPYQPKGEKT